MMLLTKACVGVAAFCALALCTFACVSSWAVGQTGEQDHTHLIFPMQLCSGFFCLFYLAVIVLAGSRKHGPLEPYGQKLGRLNMFLGIGRGLGAATYMIHVILVFPAVICYFAAASRFKNIYHGFYKVYGGTPYSGSPPGLVMELSELNNAVLPLKVAGGFFLAAGFWFAVHAALWNAGWLVTPWNRTRAKYCEASVWAVTVGYLTVGLFHIFAGIGFDRALKAYEKWLRTHEWKQTDFIGTNVDFHFAMMGFGWLILAVGWILHFVNFDPERHQITKAQEYKLVIKA